jgi:hypothetical protein
LRALAAWPEARRAEEAVFVRTCHAVLFLALLFPTLLAGPVRAQESDRPVVGGIALEHANVAGVDLLFDPDVDPDTVKTAGDAIAAGLLDVPELTGLPSFTTPIAAYILADDGRFRLALAEIANVRTELVAEEIGGYTIERDGTMLVFFAAPNVANAASAVLGYSHELAHLAVREATRRRAVPQWFNEGYASWIATRSLARHHPAEAALQQQLDRVAVASALHTRGLIPWADLVTRTRFSRAGVDGLVNLAYGQSTIFIDFLARRHGTPALARFLTTLGEGTAATPAFATAFSPFGQEAEAYETSLAALKAELQPGLYVLQRADAEQPVVLGLVGGPALETATVELLIDGELFRRRELDLDGAGMLVASVPESLLAGAGSVRLRVTAPVLGSLELDPVAGTSARPARAAPAPAASPQAAPAQVPGRSGLHPRTLILGPLAVAA